MNIIVKIIYYIIAGLLAFSLLFFQGKRYHQKTVHTEMIKTTQTVKHLMQPVNEVIPPSNIEADFLKIYNNVAELKQDATIVVEGNVQSTESFTYTPDPNDKGSTSVYTKAKVQVTKVYKGDVKEGDVLTFVEPGGVATAEDVGMKEKFPDLDDKSLKEKIEYVFDGVPNMKANDKVLLFGDKGDIPLLKEKYYETIGTHMGKFTYHNGYFARYVPEDMTDLKSLKMSTSMVQQQLLNI
ncbi:hypothetical protein ACFO4N_05390 [Camelliibacillus cellulosilyticus]|uniref:Uncharacterized protein n=1 Tax=Camelliibacillus cellulosilyticus TaxID=2174486 RepID=A0ABV9GJD0_9BACL